MIDLNAIKISKDQSFISGVNQLVRAAKNNPNGIAILKDCFTDIISNDNVRVRFSVQIKIESEMLLDEIKPVLKDEYPIGQFI